MVGRGADLPNRPVGRTDVRLSPLGFGGAQLGELFEKVPEPQAIATVECAYDLGIRYYDTAPWYGHGMSEHRLGHVLRQKTRSDFVLSTKVGRVYSRPRNVSRFDTAPWAGGLPFELRFDYSYEGIRRSYEDSLQRLGLNRIDMLIIHDLDSGYHSTGRELDAHCSALADSGWRALDELRSSGEVGAIGAGLNDMSMVSFFVERFDIDMFLMAMPYTLLDQAPLKGELQVCCEQKIGVVVGSPFASGILATGPVAGAIYNYAPAPEEIINKTRAIEAVCRRFDVPLQAAALQFPLGHPAVVSVIPGAADPRFVKANRASLDVTIPAELWLALKQEGLLDSDAPTPA